MGFALAPLRDGKIVPPDEFNGWPEDKRHEVQEIIQGPREGARAGRSPNSTAGDGAPGRNPQAQSRYRACSPWASRSMRFGQSSPDLPKVIEHLEAARTDLVDNVMLFAMKPDDDEEPRHRAGVSGRQPVPAIRGQRPGQPSRTGRATSRSSKSCIRRSATFWAISNTSRSTACW